MLRIQAKITGGILEYNEDNLKEWLSKQKDGEYVLGIKKYFKQRSLNENNYYWGTVIAEIANYTGYSPQEAHDALKSKFLPHITDEFGLTHITSTPALSTKYFEIYMEDIRRWAAEDLGVIVPLPNEDRYDNQR